MKHDAPIPSKWHSQLMHRRATAREIRHLTRPLKWRAGAADVEWLQRLDAREWRALRIEIARRSAILDVDNGGARYAVFGACVAAAAAAFTAAIGVVREWGSAIAAQHPGEGYLPVDSTLYVLSADELRDLSIGLLVVGGLSLTFAAVETRRRANHRSWVAAMDCVAGGTGAIDPTESGPSAIPAQPKNRHSPQFVTRLSRMLSRR